MKRRKYIENLSWSIYLDCKLCGYNMCNTKGSDLAQFFSAVIVDMVNKNNNRWYNQEAWKMYWF